MRNFYKNIKFLIKHSNNCIKVINYNGDDLFPVKLIGLKIYSKKDNKEYGTYFDRKKLLKKHFNYICKLKHY